MARVTVVVPRTAGDPARDAAWEFVRARYEERHPEWEIVEALGDSRQWSKGAALAPALEHLDGLVLIADADVWCNELEKAVEAVELGRAWAVPHWRVRRLTAEATAAVIDGAVVLERAGPLEERPYVGCPAGGLVVMPAETARAIPLDPRFVGWGGEDRSWGWALRCLLGGSWRGKVPLWHLWHAPQARETRNRGNAANEALRRRYDLARADREAMRRLLEEASP